MSDRDTMPRWFRWSLVVAVLVLLVAGSMWMVHVLADPRVVLLKSAEGASWLRVDRSLNSMPHFGLNSSAVFAGQVSIPPSFSGAVLHVAGLRRVKVLLDDRELFDSGANFNRSRTVHDVALPAGIPAGTHILKCAVFNHGGPAMVRVSCPSLAVRSDGNWRATADGMPWSPAIEAESEWDVQLPPRFTDSSRDVRQLCVTGAIVFLVGCAVLSRLNPTADWGSRIRWILLLAWMVLSGNNIFKVPPSYGYDVGAHLLYIHFVAHYLVLPRPDAGWQFFQAPLYYLMSGIFDRLFMAMGFSGELADHLLRIIPLLCGAAMIELGFQSAKTVFPDQPALQAIATATCGLLPMNIYMSQALSNEPLAAVMGAGMLLCSFQLLENPQRVRSQKQLCVIGALVGLAVLTKVSTLLYMPPLAVALAWALYQGLPAMGQRLRAVGMVAVVSIAICGWYLVRSFRLGATAANLSSAVAPTLWWQDPGYRTPNMFYEFGRVFRRPIYNGISSVWDSLYGTMWGNGILIGKPEWNYRLMSAGLWLAVVPVMLIAWGACQAALSRRQTSGFQQRCLRFATLSIACFIPAIVYVYLTLPSYSVGKASYLLGTAPCIGILTAGGFDRMFRRRWLRLMMGSTILCWAITAYLTYFVI
jgi:hypothetical protein